VADVLKPVRQRIVSQFDFSVGRAALLRDRGRPAGRPYQILTHHLATARRHNTGIQTMNKQEIAETLRNEVGELEVSIKKLQARCDRLKSLVLKLEAEIAGPSPAQIKALGPDSKFRKMIDKVFGEEPKRPKR